VSPAEKDGGNAASDRGDPRVRFSGAAEGYARFRPGDPEELVDWLVAESAVREGDRVVDVGCGTGIQLLRVPRG
jgi:hypothetical protein